MRELTREDSNEDNAREVQEFVEDMMPFIRPCVLIAAACGLAFFSGPTSAEHAHAAVLVDGHGTRLAARGATR